MKQVFRTFAAATLLALSAAPALAADAREIDFKTSKVGDAVHWEPAKVEVHPGEKVKFVVQHQLEGGFDFHGFSIPALKIAKQVDRNKPLTVETTIPSDLKAGEYDILCQFHPKHVGAKLVVKK
jgi:plastocyanin